jgi:hypothetical protein
VAGFERIDATLRRKASRDTAALLFPKLVL